jgi:hypothetical protein
MVGSCAAPLPLWRIARALLVDAVFEASRVNFLPLICLQKQQAAGR